MSDRKDGIVERGRVMYCLEYIIRRMIDSGAHVPWSAYGVPSGMFDNDKFLTAEQVSGHSELVKTQEDLDRFVSLAAVIIFKEAFPRAWDNLMSLGRQSGRIVDPIGAPERCVIP